MHMIEISKLGSILFKRSKYHCYIFIKCERDLIKGWNA